MIGRRCGLAAAAAALLVHTVPAQAPVAPGANLQVFLVTMGPGASVYERFGHNAIWIRDTVAHSDLIYNFGTFDVPDGLSGALHFIGDFAMGRPRYWLSVDNSLDNELALYHDAQRDLVAQQLDLTPAQRADIAHRLAVNAEPANRYYIYDYYRDNCSTRVRDLLDAVLGGALRRATIDHPAAGTVRFHTLRSITNDELLNLGIDAAMGPRADRPIDQWAEMFLPVKVQQRVAELRVTGPDGTTVPLVESEFPLLTINRYHVAPAPPRWDAVLLAIGVALGGVMLLGLRGGAAGAAGRLVATAWLLLAGIGGLLLLFFWWISFNVFTYSNHNIFLLSPLALLVMPSLWYSRPRPPPHWRWMAVHLLVVSVGLGCAVAIAPIVGYQDPSIVLLAALPTLAAAWLAAVRMRDRGGNGEEGRERQENAGKENRAVN